MSLAPETSAARRVKEIGRDSGFDLVRITTAARLLTEESRFRAWLSEGRQGKMRWIDEDWVSRAGNPRSVLAGARSVISAGLSYGHVRGAGGGRGRVARYAWGGDYHAFVGERLSRMAERVNAELGGTTRWYVDTGPLMDKALAARAGIGWYGKHTNLITDAFGSYVVLGEIVTSLDLAPDQPVGGDCGACRLCQVACPTGALDEDYRIDARRCISYLTIEHRGPIPLELRPLVGDWVFGCDICQEVCPPGNRPYLNSDDERGAWVAATRSQLVGMTPAQWGEHAETIFGRPARDTLDLAWLLRLDHATYLESFRGTAIRRARVWMLRRNAAVALGNTAGASALPLLAEALASDDNSLVRGHAAWAIGHICRRLKIDPHPYLVPAAARETDSSVLEEIYCASVTQ